MKFLISNRYRFIAFLHDVAMIPVAWLCSYWLRFNLQIIPNDILITALYAMLFLMTIQSVIFLIFKLYRGVWQFASLTDLSKIIKAVITGCCLTAALLFFYNRIDGIPRSIFPLYAILLTSLLCGARILVRWYTLKKDFTHISSWVLIVGAGQAGEGLARDLLRNATQKYKPIGFIDDDPLKQGREIHGIRVLGKCDDISKIAKQHNVDMILIALPSIPSKEMRRIVNHCEIANIPFRTLPGLKDLTTGRVSINTLREVSIEDLLGRETVSLDWEKINKDLYQKIVLVSGGGGSIGSELCRQIAKLNPSSLIVLDNCEFNLYSLDLEFRQKFPDINSLFLLADVNDYEGIQNIFLKFNPEIVFHAAAYKHVPLLEHQLRTAIRNNILGTHALANASIKYNVKKFILISTDKAVNPTSIMGVTKRVAEILCQNLNALSKTRFITVRFGNVLDSAGSVLPLFRKQIANGGPVTVTHPEISRYFMTIPEAVQLILQATVMGKGGEIFILDMGEPIKIRYLAEQMIKLAGFKLGEEIQLHYIGLRPGEKLFEELFHEDEKLISTEHKKILQAQYRPWNWDILESIITHLANACEENDELKIQDLLSQLVPEYAAPSFIVQENTY